METCAGAAAGPTVLRPAAALRTLLLRLATCRGPLGPTQVNPFGKVPALEDGDLKMVRVRSERGAEPLYREQAAGGRASPFPLPWCR